MTGTANASQLAEDLRALHAGDPADAPRAIEALLQERLAGCSPAQGRRTLISLLQILEPRHEGDDMATDEAVLNRICGLLLGRRFAPGELSADQMLERLGRSMNTIFDALNRLIASIDTVFSGEDDGSQTIRHFIGDHMEGEDAQLSLEAHIRRINDAFLLTHEAFKAAAKTKFAQVLNAVSQETVAAERSGGLKLGPLRKAEDHDILREKIDRIQRWFDSERFMEDFLREFEKQCQEITRK
ncbi:hypothetical protein [Desulfatitalea alkaliphila]|uniref:Uncharacterized protein n=1 Tax=Desulfatitalea alkaliphila TaxID=2929485 RepID=A0AA41R632_9BACT|nr:hypothetical protein [Desulfatitalea alkaliphila]MCJ8501800.1 hypothetical protein [Desulfatitalea alkaliphila]